MFSVGKGGGPRQGILHEVHRRMRPGSSTAGAVIAVQAVHAAVVVTTNLPFSKRTRVLHNA